MTNYNTGSITLSNTTFIIQQANSIYHCSFPTDIDKLKTLLDNLYDYLIVNGLTDSALYEQLNKKHNQFELLGDKDVFKHIREVVSLHHVLLSTSFGIKP